MQDWTTEFYRDEAGHRAAHDRGRDRRHWVVENARGRVLDVGCGRGAGAILCARSGHEVLGLDADADVIEIARAERERRPRAVQERLDFRVGDAGALELPDGSFDTVILDGVIEHLEDVPAVLREVARVTAPDGRVLVTAPFGYSAHADVPVFYVGSLTEALAPHVTVESIEVVDRILRVVAHPGAMAEDAVAMPIRAGQASQEATVFDHEVAATRAGRRAAREHRRQARAIGRLERRERNLERRLGAMKRSRWTRLGAALSGARTLRGFVGLPREAARALRRLPPPEPVVEVLPETPPEPEPRTLTVSADAVAGIDGDLMADVPQAIQFPDGPVVRPGLRVATILDPFSAAAFRYEWDQLEIGPEDWRERLSADPPDLLFVESAWRANGDRWAQAVVGSGRFAREFAELIAWCRAAGIPTVFWNKEDPPRYNTFLPAARLFDHVFTTDSNRVGFYQEDAGHENVEVMMFGVQPRIHNPVAPPGARRHPVAFAGTYLAHKHPGRRRQMETVLDPARDFGLHIFSRVPPGEANRFEWPEKYRPHIVGSLPYERMVTAAKAYRLFLNVNTVVRSPTMCARRAFEMSATGTALLSGDSLALRKVFGDLVAIAETADEARDHLEQLLGDPDLAAGRGHAAMRHVLRGHTYSERVDQVLRTVGLDQHLRPPRASISVIVPIDDEAPPGLMEMLAAQTHEAREVIAAPLPGAADRAEGELLAIVGPTCEYGEHLLEDLAAAFEYTDAGVVGKPRSAESAHSYTLELQPEALLARTSVVRETGFGESGEDPVAGFLEACQRRGVRGYAADPYSFERRPLRSIGI